MLKVYKRGIVVFNFNPFNTELNSICHLLALLGAHHILHISRIRVKNWMRELQRELKWHKQEKRDHYLHMRVQFELYTEWQ